MAKDYQKGLDYRLYYNTGTYANATWAQIKAVEDLAVDPGINDISAAPRGNDIGHMHGKPDPVFNFTLLEDKGDANVEALIAATIDDTTMIHLAVSRGDITANTVKYWHMECALFAPLDTNQGEVAQYGVEARRHLNSDNDLVRATA